MKNKSKMSAPIPAPAPKSKGLSIPQILGLLMFIYIAAAVFGGQKTCEGLVGSPEVCKTVQSFLPY